MIKKKNEIKVVRFKRKYVMKEEMNREKDDGQKDEKKKTEETN